jgi:hypothetical protein
MYNEKQLYKKFLKVIEIPPFGRLDSDMMNDLKFYTRFLSIYAAKMKKDWVKENKGYEGMGLIERRRTFEEKQDKKLWKACNKKVQKKEKIYEESTSSESYDPSE